MVGQEQGTKVSETQGRFSYLCGVEKGRQLGLGKKWERHESDEGGAAFSFSLEGPFILR